MVQDFQKNALLFKAFCDENRLKILNRLRDGEQCSCDLLEGLQISQPTLSYHMGLLSASGVVEIRREGKWSYYALSKSGGERIIALLCEIVAPPVDEKPRVCEP
ncbi:MAG: winged helix-turn-helix transcriptional regulator [Coriobacteriia bacterium]|nr:winged helix-turn-helix transcriptional regulator [Coriobacteriia bacterium]